MKPLVSIIIPHRNHKHALPRLLESIQRQSLKELEVIIVDDNSDESCADVVAAFAGQGLSIRLFENKQRLYTTKARLFGVKHSNADCFMFADADDSLWGETALEKHVLMQRDTQADIVHFRCVMTDAEGNFSAPYVWADPFAPELEEEKIFEAFAKSELEGQVIWNKIFSRYFWLKHLSQLERFPIHSAFEDVFLNSFLFFHAHRYYGSSFVGYGYHWINKNYTRALERSMAIFTTLEILVPHLGACGKNAEHLARYAHNLQNYLGICVGRAGLHALHDYVDLDVFLQKHNVNRENFAVVIKALLAGSAVNGRKLQDAYKAITGLS